MFPKSCEWAGGGWYFYSLRCCFLTGTISSTCHILSGMFYSGPKPTKVFTEKDAVGRRCHQTCLIQKTKSWVATPQFTTTAGIHPISSPFSTPPPPPRNFLFPTPSGSVHGILIPCDCSQLKTSHQPLFPDGQQTYQVNLMYYPDTFQQHARFGYEEKKKRKIHTSECDQKNKKM